MKNKTWLIILIVTFTLTTGCSPMVGGKCTYKSVAIFATVKDIKDEVKIHVHRTWF